MEKITVNVTKDLILIGRRASCYYCPVALDLKRQFPGKAVRVTLKLIRVGDDFYKVPRPLAQFMGNYDYTRKKEDVKEIKIDITKTSMCAYCKHVAHFPGECRGAIPGKIGTKKCDCGSH
jgi:hypothetical protein